MIRRNFVYCGIKNDIECWPCAYNFYEERPIRFLDENNDITKKVWSGTYYSGNVKMNTLIRYLYNL